MMRRLAAWVFRVLLRLVVYVRGADLVIGGDDRYLSRWYITPWRGWFRHVPEQDMTWWQNAVVWLTRFLPNVYLHCFERSDDDRALHDHPWLFNASWVLEGEYVEHTIAAGGIHHERTLSVGQFRARWGASPHRIELRGGPVWTLFVTGPVVRRWGFHCPKGWVHWPDFTANNGATVGRGCDQ